MRQWQEAQDLGVGAKKMFDRVATEYLNVSVGGQYPLSSKVLCK